MGGRILLIRGSIRREDGGEERSGPLNCDNEWGDDSKYVIHYFTED